MAFFCTDCGNESPKWLGRCPYCSAWNTLVESESVEKRNVFSKANAAVRGPRVGSAHPERMSELSSETEPRFGTGFSELDRVLGGGAVLGSLVLLSGEPGIGKSTLLLQLCGLMAPELDVLYFSGEESTRQIKLRAERLGITRERLYLLSATSIDDLMSAAEEVSPAILIIDSIQTLYNPANNSTPGSVSQVKDCALTLMQYAKNSDCTVFLVGHVNKDGGIAGPKTLEHMVDCVLYFEGERSANYRILRAVKNRYGSTNEIGMFEMRDSGLKEVPNPSEQLLSDRPVGAPGTCVTCVMEGTRPVLAEIQALVAPTSFGNPRRNSNGIDYGRAMLLLAVLEKRGGFATSGCDAYINVIGGLEIEEPAADLATILAIASSHCDRPIDQDTVAIGEVGLTGEVRSVGAIEQRLQEVARLGFTRCVVPSRTKGIKAPRGLELIAVNNIRNAISILFGSAKTN